MRDVAAGTAEIHGFAPDGELIVFVSGKYAYKKWFRNTGRRWRPSHLKALAELPLIEGGEVEWQAWLAAQPDFWRAGHILAGDIVTGDWGADHRNGFALQMAAESLASTQPEMARWLARRSWTFYCQWMGQATSGGEGNAIEKQIREDLRSVEKIMRAK